jgi:hypothetical protein
MTELSHAAQAVRKAYYSTNDDLAGPALAAALRAAAKPFHWTWNAEMCHKHLVAIADELEAQ